MKQAAVLRGKTRAAPHARTWRGMPWLLLLFVLAASLLLGAEALLLSSGSVAMRLASDDRAAALLLSGVHGVEHDDRAAFRWTTAASNVQLYALGSGPQVIDLELGPAPPVAAAPEFALSLASRPPITLPRAAAPRRYHILVPTDTMPFGALDLGLRSATVQVPPDTRAVGLRLEAATLRTIGAARGWPAPAWAALQCALLALGVLLLRRLRVPLPWISVAAAGLIAALLLLFAAYPLVAFPYVLRLTSILALLCGATLWLLPLAERALVWAGPPRLVRALVGVTLLACGIRLAGALFPLFEAHDLALNADRFLRTLGGTLVVTRRSFEFRDGITIYPPGPYLAFLPLLLLGLKPALLLQTCVALFDGLGALPAALLARKLGASQRATVFVALLYAALPINLTALYWGLSAQVFGQMLMLPLALALLFAMEQGRWRWWLVAGALCTIALLSHIGVAILAVAWLGLAWLALSIRRTLPRVLWRRYTGIGLACCALAVLLIYIAVAVLKVEQFSLVGEKVAARDYTPAYNLILRGFQIALYGLGLLLLWPGMLLLGRRRMPRGGIELIGGWIVAVFVFWAVEMYSGLQVRYIYFFAPVACLLAATALDRLARRGVLARWLAWTTVVLLVAQSSAVWVYSAFEHVQMSMASLLR